MCSGPILAGFSVLTEAMSIQAESQALTAQASALGDYAARSTSSRYAALGERQYEESVRTALEVTKATRKGASIRGTIMAQQAESGLAGRSFSRDFVESFLAQDEEIGAIRTSNEFVTTQLQREKLGAKAEGESLRKRAKETLKQRPDALSVGLRLLGAGMSGYSRGESLESPFRTSGGKAPSRGQGLSKEFMDRKLFSEE